MRRLIGSLFVVSCAVYLGCGGSAPAPAPGTTAVTPPGVVAPPGVVPPGVTPPGTNVTFTGTPATRAATIAPYLDEMTVAVARVDVGALNIAAMEGEIIKMAGPSISPKELEETKKSTAMLKDLQKQIQEIYIVVSLNDVPLFPPFGVVKMHPGADAKKIFAMYKSGDTAAAVDQKQFDDECFVKGDIAVIGNSRKIFFFKNSPPSAGIPVPNIEQAFTLAGNSQVQAIYVPTNTAREQLAKSFPTLPPELGIDGPAIVNGLSYAAVSMKAPPGFELKLEAQGRDAASAAQLHGALTKVFDTISRAPNVPPEQLAPIKGLMPQLSNDKLTFSLKESDPLYKQMEQMVTAGAGGARTAATRMQSSNNLKQIALAFHNYEQAQRKFPAPNQNGLSWRVHLLPFLEETELYRKFNLNEPWDSATNKPLADKMPKIYMHPTAKTAAPNMTVYVLPTGEGTVFPPAGPLTFAGITDGTANTILAMEVNPESAVIWTKPDDWQMNPSSPTTGLGGLWGDSSFHIALVDGGVRRITTADAEQLRRAINPKDSQVIDWTRIAALGGAGPGAGASPFPNFNFGPPGAGGPQIGPPLVGPPRFPGDGVPLVPGTVAPGAVAPGETAVSEIASTAQQGEQAVTTKYGGKTVRVTAKIKVLLGELVNFESDVRGPTGDMIQIAFALKDATSKPEGGLDATLQNPVTIQGEFEYFRNNMVRFKNATWVKSGDPLPGAAAGSFVEEAKKAFKSGRDADGFQYLYAEAIGGEDKDGIKDMLKLDKAHGKIGMALRFGVGIQYTSPRNFGGPPMPVGRIPAGALNDRGAGVGTATTNPATGPQTDPNAPKEDAAPTAILDYYTAELGTKVLEGLQTRLEQGQFGAVQALVADSAAFAPAAGGGVGAAGQPPFNPGGQPFNPGQPGAPNPQAELASRALAGKPISLSPGLVWLGIEKQKDLLAKAKAEGLDGLIMFEIAVSPGNGFTTNTTRILLLDVAKPDKTLFGMPGLKNNVVEVARKQNKGDDPVDKYIEALMAKVDEFKLEDLPELDEAKAATRVKKLTEAPPAIKLAAVYEIAVYQAKGLVTPENAAIAYEKIVGPEGAKLAGTLEERKAAITKLLPKSGGGGGKKLGLP